MDRSHPTAEGVGVLLAVVDGRAATREGDGPDSGRAHSSAHAARSASARPVRANAASWGAPTTLHSWTAIRSIPGTRHVAGCGRTRPSAIAALATSALLRTPRPRGQVRRPRRVHRSGLRRPRRSRPERPAAGPGAGRCSAAAPWTGRSGDGRARREWMPPPTQRRLSQSQQGESGPPNPPRGREERLLRTFEIAAPVGAAQFGEGPANSRRR